MGGITIEQIKEQYHSNDVCMFELLATIPADGFNLEDAFKLYIEARKWADNDKFIVQRDEDDIEEL